MLAPSVPPARLAVTSRPPSVMAGTPPPGWYAPGPSVAALVAKGGVAEWVGRDRPLVVITSMSPFGCASARTSSTLLSLSTAASRWFSISAVFWPSARSCTTRSLRLPIWASVPLSVPTSATIAACAALRPSV